MKTNELRIGNWVKYNPDMVDEDWEGEWEYQVECIYSDQWESFIKLTDPFNERYALDEVLPIPLTEEWLGKFGFEKYNNSWWKYDKNGAFDISNNFDAFGFKTCIWSSDRINYVHQLQNLYFALTGDELEIK